MKLLNFAMMAALVAGPIACTSSQDASNVNFAANTTNLTNTWTTRSLAAGIDPNINWIESAEDLENLYGSSGYQIFTWNRPAGAADTDYVYVTSNAVQSTFDADLFLMDNDDEILLYSMASSSSQSISGVRVGDFPWPFQIFVGAWGQNGQQSQVSVRAMIIGTQPNGGTTKVPVNGLSVPNSLVSNLQTLCGEVSGARFTPNGASPSCVCPTGVVPFSTFQNVYASSGTVQSTQFLSDCAGTTPSQPQPVVSSLAVNLQTLCGEVSGARFTPNGASPSCVCPTGVVPFSTFQNVYASSGTVQSTQFLSDCAGTTPSQPLPTQNAAATQLISACGSVAGASLTGSGNSSVCNCGNSQWSASNFQESFLSAGGNPQGFAGICQQEVQQAQTFQN